MKETIGKVIIDYEDYSGRDLYCDGDIEDQLLEIVKTNPQSDYNKVIAEQKQWPIMYHLSNMRTNLLEWIPVKKDASVLEIGSGCGAITGILAKKHRQVTCIDLSKKRSLINAYRNREFNNIFIKVGNFQDIEKKLNEKYDYITLIGVFEYGASYISGKDPYENFLKKVMSHLKEEGQLIIAIENRLGLKYWAGCQEDHVRKYFEGIEGYSNTKGIKTFSKKELESLFERLGIKKYEFYYPYPDYKFPMTIYSDDFLPSKGQLNNNIRNFDLDRIVLFDESKVFDTLIDEGVFPQYSNSFLIILEKGAVS